MNKKNKTMIDSLKMVFIMDFLEFLMIDVNGVGILGCPFPSENGVFKIKIDSVHNIGTHVKGRYHPGRHKPIFFYIQVSWWPFYQT